MSPLWRDEIGVFIGPTKVALVRMRRGIRPKCVAEQCISVDTRGGNAWQSAIATLREQLANNLWHDAIVRVVVSDHWAQYAILPWSAEISGTAERLAHARLIIKNSFGDIAEKWTITLSESRPRAPTVICAIPTQLLDEIQQTFAEHKCQLRSLQADLLVAFNHWRDKVTESSAWFASVEEGSLAALHLTNGRCDRVHSVRLSDDWDVEMKRIQTMGRLAQGRPTEGRVFVDAPDTVRESADKDDKVLEWLEDDRSGRTVADRVSLMKGTFG